MEWLTVALLLFLIGCVLAVSFCRNLLKSVLIFTAFGLALSVVWVLLQAPDLAITEAAVGTGVTTILLVVTLYRMHLMNRGARRDK